MPNPPLTPRFKRIYDRLRKAKHSAQVAHSVAEIHQRADALNLDVEWDEDESEDGQPRWVVTAVDAEGVGDNRYDSMDGVDLGDVGPDAHYSDPYQYVAEADVLRQSFDMIDDEDGEDDDD